MPFSLLWCLQRETNASYATCLVHAEKDILQKRAHKPSWNKKINLLFSVFNRGRQNPSNLKIAAVSYHYRHKQLLFFYKKCYSLPVTTFTNNTLNFLPLCLVQNLLWIHISTRQLLWLAENNVFLGIIEVKGNYILLQPRRKKNWSKTQTAMKTLTEAWIIAILYW